MLFFQKKKERKWRWQQLKSSLWSVLLFLDWSVTAVSESLRYGRSSASDIYSTGSWLGCKKGKVLFGRLWIFHCERKKKLVILSIVRGSMVRRSSSSQISHNIENYLRWEKKVCFFSLFFSFSWVLISPCELWVWMNVFLTSVYAKCCPFHGFLIYFLSWGNSWECASGPSVSSAVCLSEGHRELCFLLKLKRCKDNIHTPCWRWPHLLNSSLFSFFRPFKG